MYMYMYICTFRMSGPRFSILFFLLLHQRLGVATVPVHLPQRETEGGREGRREGGKEGEREGERECGVRDCV